jgi:hypothetical protein
VGTSGVQALIPHRSLLTGEVKSWSVRLGNEAKTHCRTWRLSFPPFHLLLPFQPLWKITVIARGNCLEVDVIEQLLSPTEGFLRRAERVSFFGSLNTTHVGLAAHTRCRAFEVTLQGLPLWRSQSEDIFTPLFQHFSLSGPSQAPWSWSPPPMLPLLSHTLEDADQVRDCVGVKGVWFNTIREFSAVDTVLLPWIVWRRRDENRTSPFTITRMHARR